MTDRQPVALSEDEIAAVRSWVIHEDAHVIAFSKPSGLSSQGGRIKAHTLDDLLWAFARSNGKRPELVHRLDRDTSGVILAAKTKPAAGFLGKALQMRRFRKQYLALLSAAPEPRSGTVDAPLRREEIGRESYMRVVAFDAPGAQGSQSRYRTLAASDHGAVVGAGAADRTDAPIAGAYGASGAAADRGCALWRRPDHAGRGRAAPDAARRQAELSASRGRDHDRRGPAARRFQTLRTALGL